MDGVEHIPTGKVQLSATVPDLTMWPKQVVSHVMQGFQTTMIGWARERPPVTDVAIHFTIGRNGRIVQHKEIWSPGRHVGWQDWNLHTVGIEHEGFSVNPGYSFDYLYSVSQPWPEAMILSSIRVHRWVFEAIRAYDPSVFPDESTIITHAMTGQPDRQNDPGALFMQQVRPRLLAAFAPPPPPAPVFTQADIDTAFRAGRKEMYFGLKDKIASLESEWNV